MEDQSTLKKFAQILADSKKLVVSTGAGISKESGIPTFRDAPDALWAKYDPMELATPTAFRRNPKLVWDWYQYRRELVNQAKPNRGHYALADLEDLLPQVVIVTQNIDGFHHQVGSTDIICLHGNIQRDKCFANCRGNPTYVDTQTLAWDNPDLPPICPFCEDSFIRPDVVWFEEALPREELERAYLLSSKTDVMLMIGTSGKVYPAADLPRIAYQHGAIILEINPNPSEITPLAKIHLAGPSGEFLPQIVNIIRQLKTQ
jgi:NAD-dependent deacetylase